MLEEIVWSNMNGDKFVYAKYFFIKYFYILHPCTFVTTRTSLKCLHLPFNSFVTAENPNYWTRDLWPYFIFPATFPSWSKQIASLLSVSDRTTAGLQLLLCQLESVSQSWDLFVEGEARKLINHWDKLSITGNISSRDMITEHYKKCPFRSEFYQISLFGCVCFIRRNSSAFCVRVRSIPTFCQAHLFFQIMDDDPKCC